MRCKYGFGCSRGQFQCQIGYVSHTEWSYTAMKGKRNWQGFKFSHVKIETLFLGLSNNVGGVLLELADI